MTTTTTQPARLAPLAAGDLDEATRFQLEQIGARVRLTAPTRTWTWTRLHPDAEDPKRPGWEWRCLEAPKCAAPTSSVLDAITRGAAILEPARIVVVGSGDMPYRSRDPRGRYVPTDFPMWEFTGHLSGPCGAPLGTLWRHPKTGRWSSHVRGEGATLADHETQAEALESRGLARIHL